MSGPQEGTPNGVDRLADIEAWAHDILSIATISRARDVLALVEIARGMERIEKTCNVVVQRIAEVGEPPAALSGTQIDAERMRDFARSALARLDSGAAE